MVNNSINVKKGTITSHLNLLEKNKPNRHMKVDIQAKPVNRISPL